MATLYRRYRPQTFKELVGQDHIRDTLRQALLQDKLTHAYLFHGPRGTGKTTTARLLAKRVNCLKPKQEESCGKCASCLAMQAGKHPDVLEIDAASNRGIDDVRALREAAAYSPGLGKYKVYIIDEVHMLTKEAASALLKTLEEPVAQVIFILATTELHKVLATIASRCQVHRFRRARPKEMRQRLTSLLEKEKREAGDDVLGFIIDRTDGCYRDAESLLGQVLTIQPDKISLDELVNYMGLPPKDLLENFLRALVAGESAPALAAVDEAFAGGVDAEQFMREAVRSARDEAVRQAMGEKLVWADDGQKLGDRAPHIIRALLQALQDLAYVPEPMIAVHLAVLSVCDVKGDAPEKVVNQVELKPTKALGLEVSAVKSVWRPLIDQVKKTNPVAATFLRAVQPVSVTDNTVTIAARYALHRTFFEKTDSKRLVAETLGSLLKQEVEVTFILDEAGVHKGPSLAEQRQTQEKKFEDTVKEVFG